MAIWRMFKFSVKISWQTPYLIPVASASSWIVQRWSLWMNSQIFSIFFIILLVLGHPEHSSSSADTRPALKHECHLKSAVWLKECSPKAPQSISRVSVVDLPSFMQNYMQTCCSILPSIRDKMKHEVKKALV
jgi:hypothetical protein